MPSTHPATVFQGNGAAALLGRHSAVVWDYPAQPVGDKRGRRRACGRSELLRAAAAGPALVLCLGRAGRFRSYDTLANASVVAAPTTMSLLVDRVSYSCQGSPPVSLLRLEDPLQSRGLWCSLGLPSKIFAAEDNLTGGHSQHDLPLQALAT